VKSRIDLRVEPVQRGWASVSVYFSGQVIYQGSDGGWHGRVTVGIRDDGRADRRHVRGKSRSEVTVTVRTLERDRDQGSVRKVAERWTVGQWLTYWIENNPRTDYTEWKRLLKEAGLREGRLHDARHTAATVLLVLRQPTPTVMSLMGRSSGSMAARYQHVTDAMRSQVASQVGELIWDSVAGNDDHAMLIVHRGSLTTVLAAIEECLATHRGGTGQRPGLLAAITDLRAALPPTTAAPE
jgi:Phage integrase family